MKEQVMLDDVGELLHNGYTLSDFNVFRLEKRREKTIIALTGE